MSDPKVPAAVLDLLQSLPALEVTEGYGERAGFNRSGHLAKKRKARVADALIDQSICRGEGVRLKARKIALAYLALQSTTCSSDWGWDWSPRALRPL
jgi:hypothetical protein